MKSKRPTRFAAAAVAVGLTVAVTACAGSPAPASSDGPSTGDRPTIAFVLPTATQPYWVAMMKAAEAAAEELGIELIMQAPQEVNVAEQNSVTNLVLERDPDALIATPLDPELSQPPLREAAKDIPVLTVDIQVADTSFLTQEVVSDNRDGGATAADALADAMGGEGEVMLLAANATTTTAQMRSESFTEQLGEYPGMEIVATQYSNEDASGTQSKVNNVLLSNPDLGGIFATEDLGCIGAMAAIKAKNLAGKVKLVCYDANPDQVQGIRDGVVTALIAQRPDVEIVTALKTALAAIRGEEGIEKTVAIPNTLMTADNLDETESLTYPEN